MLARALSVRGLMNIQFAVKDGVVYLIEVNPRASRTVPFVAKATGIPVAKIAARVMAGEKLAAFKLGVGSGLIKWATWAAICVPAMVLVMWGVTSLR